MFNKEKQKKNNKKTRFSILSEVLPRFSKDFIKQGLILPPNNPRIISLWDS